MDLSPYIQQLRDDLLAAASVGDEDSRRAAALLSGAIDPAARLAIMTALADLAGEVTEELGDTTVEVRLDGRDVRVSVTRSDPSHEQDSDEDTVTFDEAGQRWGFDQFAGFAGRRGREHRGGHRQHDDHGRHPGRGDAPEADEEDTMSAEELRRAMSDAGGELSRTTVRLFNQLKSQAERAAADQGVSLNTYISRAVQDSVRTAVPPRGRGRGPGGRRVTGFVQG